MISRDTIIRGTLALVIMLSIAATFGIVLLIQSKSLIYSYAVTQVEKHASEKTPFPVSVNMTTKTITEDPAVETFFTDTLANAPSSRERWWNQVAAFFADEDWYQNLASPVSRVIVVWPGKRKEEVAKEIGDILRWDKADREEFQELMDTTTPFVVEGKYLPGQYVAHRGATPADVQQLIYDAFKSEVLDRYTEVVSAQVPLEDTLIIASLIEREASDFTNMREVSGVIWNRLFTDMPLQLDATLQYVKGSDPYQPSWWPIVRPADKYLRSPYNTYQNEGLPPAPIANPSTEAILAALNPINTECLFYFHTRNGTYYCSATYQEHVSKLRSLYGRGS